MLKNSSSLCSGLNISLNNQVQHLRKLLVVSGMLAPVIDWPGFLVDLGFSLFSDGSVSICSGYLSGWLLLQWFLKSPRVEQSIIKYMAVIIRHEMGR